LPPDRVIRAHAAHIEKTCQNFAKVKTPGTQWIGFGVPLTEMSPDSSYGNVFSTILSLFDPL